MPLVVGEQAAPADAIRWDLLSLSLVEWNTVEQFPLHHARLPIVQCDVSRSVAVRKNHCGLVGTHSVACVPVDGGCEGADVTGPDVDFEAFDIRGLSVVPEQVIDVSVFVDVYTGDLFVL